MRPGLRLLLAASMLATLLMAWLDPADELAEPDLVLPRARLAGSGALPPAAGGRSNWPAAAAAPQASPPPGLLARPADWPAPSARALHAWQARALTVSAAMAAPSGRAASALAAAPSASAASATPATAAAAPPPLAPPFGYQWIGRIDDGQAPQALLAGSTRTVGVRVGELIDGRWRVLTIGAQQLALQWLPTGERVHIALGAAGRGGAPPGSLGPDGQPDAAAATTAPTRARDAAADTPPQPEPPAS